MSNELKIMLSTFALLFVAELGDKTQLAVISMTAKHKMPLWIFIGASAGTDRRDGDRRPWRRRF